MHVEPHRTPDQSAALIRAAPRAKVARRLSAARLVLLGQTAPAIAAQVLLSDRPGRGRKGPLTAAQERRLRDRLCAGAAEADRVCVLRGEDVRHILESEFGVLRSLQAVYDLLHRLGFGPLRPRPRHPQGDPQKQEAFKKNSPAGSPRPPPPTPARGSRSGSRTRPASASRGR